MTTSALRYHYAAVDSIAVRCPECARDLGFVARTPPAALEQTLQCQGCYFQMTHDRGIWHGLSPQREKHFARFMTEYQIVRATEGRGSRNADYYLALPFQDLSRANSRQWAIRARTFMQLEDSILPALEARHMRALDVLDIGAGNCWLSYRLSLRGHRPVAVDLITNSMDGLGAATHYLTKLRTLFPRFQAEADALPFASSQYDCIIYNASFHYSEDYLTTIAEAVRCLRDGGTIVVADSPWYSRNESGVQMVAERQQAFTGRFGFPSNGLSSQEFLTDERLERMAQLYGFTWQVFTPKYGVRWAMRPWIAKLRNRREPSQFRVYMAEVHK